MTSVFENWRNLWTILSISIVLSTDFSVNSSETKRKEIVSKEGSFASFIEELTNECTTFLKHVFVAQWQHNQFRHLTENIPSGSVVQVLDFAQNYRCIFQNEVQSAHYGYNQVAIYKVHTTDTTKLPFIPLFVFICVMILTVVKRRNQ